MYFAIFDPYDERYDSFLYEYNKKYKDNILENDNDDNNCIICWENNDIFGKPEKIKLINNLITHCDCNILVHEQCLYKWIRKTNSCPICRQTMSLNIFEMGTMRDYIIVFVNDVCIKYLRWFMIMHMCFFVLYNWIIVYDILYNDKNNDVDI